MNLLEGNPVPNMKINPRAKQGFQYGGHEISGGMPCSIELRGSQLSLPFEFLGSLMYLAVLQYIYIYIISTYIYIYYINIYIYYINIYIYISIYIYIVQSLPLQHAQPSIYQNNIGWKFHIMRIVKQFWVSTTFFLETQHTSQISQINVLHNTKTLQRVKRFSHGVESSWVIRMHIVSGAQQCRTQNTAPDAASSCWFSP